MKVLKCINTEIPEYALPYLINNDDSGLTQDDIIVIDKWLSEFNTFYGLLNIEVNNGSLHFSKHPAFGMPCMCADCTIVILE